MVKRSLPTMVTEAKIDHNVPLRLKEIKLYITVENSEKHSVKLNVLYFLNGIVF